MNYKQLLKQLPTSWYEVNLTQYQRILNQKYDNELQEGDEYYGLQQIDNSLLTVAALLDINADDLRAMNATESLKVIQAIQWISTAPEPLKVKPDYIIDKLEITVDNMLTYRNIEGQQYNLDDLETVVKYFIKKPIPIKRSVTNLWKFWVKNPSPIDVAKMNMIEIITLFFFVQKQLLKSLQSIRLKQAIHLQAMMWKRKYQPTL